MKLMKWLAAIFLVTGFVSASPLVDQKRFGESLGGWDAKADRAADYELSGSSYRTWWPEVTPMLDGGIYVSLRIDHRRGVLASDDHASLEITFDVLGNVVAARASLALQGKRVTSDLIRGVGKLGKDAGGLEKTAKIGTDLVADLTEKIFREKITEPGRVTFPAVIQHNYNLLCMATVTELALDENGDPGPDQRAGKKLEFGK